MGGAFVAIADDSSAVRLNPAGIALKRVYTTTFNYEKVKGGPKSLNATIVDYKTTASAVGVSFTRQEEGNAEWDFGILAFSDKSGGGLIGISVKYFSDRESSEKDYSYDVGILIPASNKLSIGLVGQNLEKTKFEFVHKSYTVGVAYKVTPLLTAAFDYTKDKDTTGDDTIYASGLEYALNKKLKVRGGYRDNNVATADYYSLGFTLYTSSINFEYGYRWGKDDSSSNIQSFSAQFLF